MSFTDLMTDSIYLQTKTSSQNAFKEWVESWSTPASATSCRLSPISDTLRVMDAGQFKDVDYKCFLPSDTSITYNNRIKYDGDYYRIRSIKEDSLGHHIEVLIERLPED